MILMKVLADAQRRVFFSKLGKKLMAFTTISVIEKYNGISEMCLPLYTLQIIFHIITMTDKEAEA